MADNTQSYSQDRKKQSSTETGSIVNKETFNTIRDDIESAIAAGQGEVVANLGRFSPVVKQYEQDILAPIVEEEDDDERGHWGSKAEFILSCVGFSVSFRFCLC